MGTEESEAESGKVDENAAETVREWMDRVRIILEPRRWTGLTLTALMGVK